MDLPSQFPHSTDYLNRGIPNSRICYLPLETNREDVNPHYISNFILKSTCHTSCFHSAGELVNDDSTFVFKQRQRITHSQTKASSLNRRRPRKKKQIRLRVSHSTEKAIKHAIRAVACADEASPRCWPSIEQFCERDRFARRNTTSTWQDEVSEARRRRREDTRSSIIK